MSDWNMWLSSKKTRIAIANLEKELQELKNTVIDGYLLKHDSADRIAVDYAHKVGAVEGLEKAIQSIKDMGKEDDQ